MKNKILTVVFGLSIFLFILSFSIAVPILCRFFYYMLIKPLNLESSGFSYAEIKTAYDEVLNYLTLPWAKFGTGTLQYTESGAAHFADCKKLFILDFAVMFSQAAVCLLLFILNRKKKIALITRNGLSASFYAAVCAVVLPIVIGGLCAIDFDEAFVIFHKIFFPGKDNWLFNPNYDEIISVLPQEYFMLCAILIGASLLIISAVIIIFNLKRKKKITRLYKLYVKFYSNN